MEYGEALQVISSHRKFRRSPSFAGLRALLSALGEPQKQLRVIRVVGTNGKGTTCAYLSSVLRESGFRTGLFTSPFVIEFRERFQIDGEMIPVEELCSLTEETARAAEMTGEELTEFEFITAIGLLWFARQNCDIVVLEAGIGGASDATHVIEQPVLAVITSISLDHTAILGDTVEQIARDKAGVIPQNGKAALYPDLDPAARRIAENIARERNARLYCCKTGEAQVLSTGLWGSRFAFRGREYTVGFAGRHQVYNALTALAALEALREEFPEITEETIASGLKKASVPGRMELLPGHPEVLLDGGHNPGCAEALRETVTRNLAGRPLTAILGMMEDKDSISYLKTVAGLFRRILTVRPEGPRGLPAEELARRARSLQTGETGPIVSPAASLRQAAELALAETEPEGVIVVCGSFVVAGEARRLFREEFPRQESAS